MLIIFKRLITAFFIFAYKPLKIILRLIFYKIIVKSYKFYFSFLKKLGWTGFKNSPFAFLVTRKLAHIVIAAITLIIISTNLADKIKANSDSVKQSAEKTILAQLIESEFGTDEEEQLIEEFFTEEAIISNVEQTYLENLSAARIQPFIEDEIFDGEEYVPFNQEGTAVRRPGLAQTKKAKRAREEIVYYTVEQGDTVSTIADDFNISVNTILWENNLSAYSMLHPGDKLSILPFSGITHTVIKGESMESVANYYKADKEIIAEANKLSPGRGLFIGQKLLIPGGKKIAYNSRRAESYSGLKILEKLVKPKTAPSSGISSGNKMHWPTSGYRITQYYSWRHHAVDIANKIGTPIYATDAGTIEVAGWGRGYGNQIVIDHGGGRKTRYAHLSKFYVGAGERVGKGEAIGAMGSTGWSTGPHLHFEIIIGGIKYNPLNYIR